MMRDAELGLFDLVVTKEVTRFARNTVDTLVYARRLRQKGIHIHFLLDEISTNNDDYESRLTDKASNAQEESRKTSKRVVFGQTMKMREGVVFGEKIFGYVYNNGQITINEEQAKIVRLIFHKYIQEGKGSNAIAKELREKAISNVSGTLNWTGTAILRILKNEKYVGDLLQGKTYTPDYLTHASKRNNGEKEKIYIRNHHDPIVDRETFDKAQQIREERKKIYSENGSRYSTRHAFSGKVRCSSCNAVYVSRYRKLKSGSKYHYWECGNKSINGKVHEVANGELIGCNSSMVRNDALANITLQLLKHLVVDKEKIRTSILSMVTKSLKLFEFDESNTVARIEQKIEQVKRKKLRVIDLCAIGVISSDDLHETNEAYSIELKELQEELVHKKKSEQGAGALSETLKLITEKIDSILSFETFDDDTYRELINKVVVVDSFHWEFHLKKILEGSEAFKVSLAMVDKYSSGFYFLGYILKRVNNEWFKRTMEEKIVSENPHEYLLVRPFRTSNLDVHLKRKYKFSCLEEVPAICQTKRNKAGYSNVEVDVIFNL